MSQKKNRTKSHSKNAKNPTLPPSSARKRSSKNGSAKASSGSAQKASADATEERDSRLPPPGTTLVKRDRKGTPRCECVVEETGFRYNHVLFKSLSAAAKAAAKDLGITENQNGFIFWGLVQPTRGDADLLGRLEKLWTRYEATARSLLAASGELRDSAAESIARHRATAPLT